MKPSPPSATIVSASSSRRKSNAGGALFPQPSRPLCATTGGRFQAQEVVPSPVRSGGTSALNPSSPSEHRILQEASLSRCGAASIARFGCCQRRASRWPSADVNAHGCAETCSRGGGGRRTIIRPAPAAATDLLESSDRARSRSTFSFSPDRARRPAVLPARRRWPRWYRARRAEALVRARSARARRTSVEADPAQGAAPPAAWEGPLRPRESRQLARRDYAADDYEDWLLDEIEAAGIDPKRVTIEITENALISRPSGAAERLAVCAPRESRLPSTISAPAMRACLPELAPARRAQDRPRTDHRIRRRQPRPDRRQGHDPASPASSGLKWSSRGRKHRAARAARRLGLRPLPGLSRRRRADGCQSWRGSSRTRRSNARGLSGSSSFFAAAGGHDSREPSRQLQCAVEPSLRRRPVARHASLLSGRSFAAPFSRSI